MSNLPQQSLPQTPPMTALRNGVISGFVIVLPVGILNQYLIDSEKINPSSPWVFLFYALIMLGAASAGWATIRLSERAGLGYAAAAGALTYIIVQLLGILRRLLFTDLGINWLAYPFFASLMAVCGTLGGLFARKWIRDHLGSDDSPSTSVN